MTKKVLPILVILLTVCNCSLWRNEKNNFAVSEEFFRTKIENVDCDNEDRLAEVQKLFTEVAEKKDEIKVGEFEKGSNVILTLKGKSDETVVVGGHYDKTTLGCGVIDNWTGIVIVASLYKTLKEQKNEKTYKFIAFGEEEKGLIGSKALVEKMSSKQKEKTCAMVNFDSFGFDNVWTFERISDNDLIDLGVEVAKNRGFDFKLKNFKGASSDSKSFLVNGIPAITISGIDDNWKDYLHQEGDQLENVNIEKVYENYLFAIDFLSRIDSKNCNAFR